MEIGDKNPASQKIKEANYIIYFAKAISREVSSFEFDDNVNFIGCSYPYVKEKLVLAIESLHWVQGYLKAQNEL